MSPGRPPRRYCSPEHRAKARVINRRKSAEAAATTSRTMGPVAANPSVLAPLTAKGARSACAVREPGEHPGGPLALPAGAAAASRPAHDGRRRPAVPGPRRPVTAATLVALKDRIDGSTRRRRRLVALVGITGIIASGAGWLGSSNAILPSRSGAEPLASNNQWISEATVRLAAIDRELDSIAHAEATYQTRLAPQFAGRTPPTSVVRLQERKSLLLQQKAALKSQVTTVEQVDSAASELAETEEQLADLDTVLATSEAPTRNQDQADALAALNQQRDLLKRRRDAKKEDLDRLEMGAESAKSSPLPEPDDTKELAAAVIALVENPDSHRDEDDEDGGLPYTPPSVLASGRESTDRRGPSYTTGEPGDDPEAGLLPTGPPGATAAEPTGGPGNGPGAGKPGGVVGTATDGLGRVLGGNEPMAGGAPSAAPSADAAAPAPGAPQKDKSGPGGLLEKANDGLGRVLGGGRDPAAADPAVPAAGAPPSDMSPSDMPKADKPKGEKSKSGGIVGGAADGLGDVLDGPGGNDAGGNGGMGGGIGNSVIGLEPDSDSAMDGAGGQGAVEEKSRPRGKANRNGGAEPSGTDSGGSGLVMQPLGGGSAPAVVSPSEMRTERQAPSSSEPEVDRQDAATPRSTDSGQLRRAGVDGSGGSSSAQVTQTPQTDDPSDSSGQQQSSGSSRGEPDDAMVDAAVDILKDFAEGNPYAAGSIGLYEGMNDEEWENAARHVLKKYAGYGSGSDASSDSDDRQTDHDTHDRSSDSTYHGDHDTATGDDRQVDGTSGTGQEWAEASSDSSGDVQRNGDHGTSDRTTERQNYAGQDTGSQDTGGQDTGGHDTNHQNTGSQDTGSQNTDDQNTNDQNTNDQNTNDQNTNDQNTNDQNTNSQNTNDQNTNSQNTDDQHSNDQHTDSQNTNDQNTNSQNTNSPDDDQDAGGPDDDREAGGQDTSSQNSDDQNTDDQDADDQDTDSPDDDDQDTGGQDTSSQNTSSQNTSSQNTSSQNTDNQDTDDQNTDDGGDEKAEDAGDDGGDDD